MKKRLLTFSMILAGSLFMLTSYRNGPAGAGVDATGARGGAGCNNGSGCHGAANTSTTVTITLDSAGTPLRRYIPGLTYNITIRGVNTSSTSLPACGLTVTAVKASGAGTVSATNAGTLATTGLPAGCTNRTISGIGLNVVEHTNHIGPSTGSGGSGTIYTRSIPWTAPSTGTGTVMLYGVLNAVNTDLGTSGDRWNWVSDSIIEFRPSVLPITGTTTLCQSTTTSLASASSGGTWSTANAAIASVNSSGLVFGVNAGTTLVSYTAGALGFDTALITVLPATTAGTISGGTSICRTSSYTLRSTISGGTWASTNTAVATINSTTGVVTGVSVGSATISYRVTGTCGTAFATQRMTVDTTSIAGTISGTSAFCIGATTTVVRATGTGGGRWSTSTSSIATVDSNTGVVSALSAGTARITYSVSNACGTATASDTFTVIASPPAIAGPSRVCEGNTITLTNSVPSGIWRSTNPSIAFAAAGFGTVTGIRAGRDTITYTAPTGCIVSAPITVDTTPTGITGTLTACIGATSVLNNATPGGRWSSANPSYATVSSTGIVTGVNANTVTISYTMPTSGCYATAPFIVKPLPSFIQGPAAFCAGSVDSLFNLTAGGTWSSASSSVASINPTNGLLYGVTGGTAVVTYTMATGCYVTRSFLVRNRPTPSVIYDGMGNTLYTDPWFVSYQWYRDGVAIPGANTLSAGAPYNGSYTVRVVDTFGCENSSTPYVLVNVGVDELNAGGKVNIFPNPASNELHIDYPIKVSVHLLSLDGRLLLTGTNAAGKMDISPLAPGVYVLELIDETGNRLGRTRFTKQ